MARVVQRRTPPYLLIVFVILFVFATVLAVLFFNKYNGVQKDFFARDALVRKLATDEQLRRAEIRQMMTAYDNPPPGGARETVIGQLGEQVSSLGSRITGLPRVTFAEAMQDIERTSEQMDPRPTGGLAKHMKEFYDKVSVKEAEIAKLNTDKAQLTEQLNKAKQDQAAAEADFKAKLTEKDGQVASLDQKFQNFEADHNQKLADAKKEYEQSKETLNKQMQEQAEQIEALNRRIVKVTRENEELKGTKVRPKWDTGEIARRADGKVRQVLTDENLVYIDVGSKDRAIEGLRFTVYPYTGIPASGVGKGIIEITSVSENTSECRIIQQSKDDPIVQGDLVANVVFDSLRNYSFVVEGQFDLDNTGTPTPAGNKAVKDLIRRYGGQIVNEVTIDTDYVILGDPPSRPRKPDDTDPPDVWDLYQERLKAFNRYQDVKRLAEGMQVPRLGGKRFLDMVGYIPAKPEQAE